MDNRHFSADALTSLSMLIRDFSASDADAVNAVALAAFAQYEGVYSDWHSLVRGVASTADLARHAEIIVAEDGGRLIGAVAYCPPGSEPRAEFFEPDWPIIRMLVVAPDARGKGVGRRLTEACIERARRDGAQSISLHTSPAMAAALALYQRIGFRRVRALPDRFGVPYGLYRLDLDHHGSAPG
jgi:ribosomal protein S18 acetylase RimI-like enzyme